MDVPGGPQRIRRVTVRKLIFSILLCSTVESLRSLSQHQHQSKWIDVSADQAVRAWARAGRLSNMLRV